MTNSELHGMPVLDWLIESYHDRRGLIWESYESPHMRWREDRLTVCLGRYEYVFIAPIDRHNDLAFIRRANVEIDKAMKEFVKVITL